MTSFDKAMSDLIQDGGKDLLDPNAVSANKENEYLRSHGSLLAKFPPCPPISMTGGAGAAEKESPACQERTDPRTAAKVPDAAKMPNESRLLGPVNCIKQNGACAKSENFRASGTTLTHPADKEPVVGATSDCVPGEDTEDADKAKKVDEKKEERGDKPRLRNKYIDFAAKVDMKKILALNEKGSEMSEASDLKNKRAHTNYRKGSVRNEITKYFFSFDWYSEYLSKYSLEANFTPEVYWHYIGSQYFPADIVKAMKDPESRLEEVREKLRSCLAGQTSPCSKAELDSFANAHLLKTNADLIDKDEEESLRLKRPLATDILLSSLEEQFAEHSANVRSIQKSVASRLSSSYLQASSSSSLGLRSGKLAEYGEEVARQYTKKSLEDFERQTDMEDVLRDSVYPDFAESAYFECMEKKSFGSVQAENVPALGSIKKSGLGLVTRRKPHIRKPVVVKEGTEELAAEQEGNCKVPSSFTISRKRAGIEPGQHRINSYIQDYRSHIKHVDDTVCQICNDGDYEDHNMIVFCAKCNISVHQKCYGISELPSGDWVCQLCATFGAKQGRLLRCPLCSIRGGAMKPTTMLYSNFPLGRPAAIAKKSAQSTSTDQGTQSPHLEGAQEKQQKQEDMNLVYDFKQDFTQEELANEPLPEVAWIHLSCAYWLPELELATKDISEPISGLEQVDTKRFKLVCSICKQRGTGCCIQCSKGKCQAAFHVECARLAGLYMEFSAYKEESAASIVYCEKHRPLRLRKAIEQARKRSADDVVNFCKIVEKCRSISDKVQGDRDKGKYRKCVGNKFFNKLEKKRLMTRIRHVCKKYGLLTVNLSKHNGGNGESDQMRYKVAPNTYKLTYKETLSKRWFPWNEMKFSKFTALNCYNKYLSLVPNEDTFKRKVLHLGKKRIEKEERMRQKALKLVQAVQAQVVVAPAPLPPRDTTLYCYCHKTIDEGPPGEMLGKERVR